MPKLPSLTARLAATNAKGGLAEYDPTERDIRPVKKGEVTERQQQVMQLWAKVAKPSRVFETEGEQLAYLAGIQDEKRAQAEYNYLLAEAGLR